jgi:hypothetical protein
MYEENCTVAFLQRAIDSNMPPQNETCPKRIVGLHPLSISCKKGLALRFLAGKAAKAQTLSGRVWEELNRWTQH